MQGCCSVPLLGAIAGCHCWGAIAGVPLLGPPNPPPAFFFKGCPLSLPQCFQEHHEEKTQEEEDKNDRKKTTHAKTPQGGGAAPSPQPPSSLFFLRLPPLTATLLPRTSRRKNTRRRQKITKKKQHMQRHPMHLNDTKKTQMQRRPMHLSKNTTERNNKCKNTRCIWGGGASHSHITKKINENKKNTEKTRFPSCIFLF